MQHFFRLPLSVASAAALALASTPIQPVAAQEDGSAADLNASVGYYYQQGDLNEADGSGVKGRLAYNISNGLTLGANLSYDEAFDTRFTDDIKYRFGSNGYGTPSIAFVRMANMYTEYLRYRDGGTPRDDGTLVEFKSTTPGVNNSCYANCCKQTEKCTSNTRINILVSAAEKDKLLQCKVYNRFGKCVWTYDDQENCVERLGKTKEMCMKIIPQKLRLMLEIKEKREMLEEQNRQCERRQICKNDRQTKLCLEMIKWQVMEGSYTKWWKCKDEFD